MIEDFHTHILPEIDDGSCSVEESLQMLRMETEQGIGHVVATPHFYPRYDYPESFLKKRSEAFRAIRNLKDERGDLPRITLGAEVHYFPRMSESDALQQLTIGQSRFLLLEMPMKKWTDSMYRELDAIYHKQGLVPIIAHLDRYLHPFCVRKVFRRLAKFHVLVQVNAEFFTNKRTSRLALWLLRKKMIHLIGSDCHNMNDRKPNLGSAIEVIHRRLGEDGQIWIQRHQQMILEGEMKL